MFKPTRLSITRHLAASAVVLLLSGSAWAVPAAQFDSAFETFTQARAGNSNAIDKSAESFAALLKAEPVNPLLMAYAGASTAMRANTTWLPWKKMTYAEDGLALLDKALALLNASHHVPPIKGVPAALEVRLIAANTFLAVPGFMNRGARGAKLLTELVASPLLASTPLGFRGEVWLTAAEQASKQGRLEEARGFLNEVLKASAPQASVARSKLAGLAS